MGEKRITQADVAARCGVHRATVSLALKEHPSIPRETRDRVRAAARRLGYVPDPMLSALAAYRGRLLPRTFRGTLAWIARNEPSYSWRAIRHFAEYCDGARAAAKRHGFNLELFNVGEPRFAPERLGAILRARNITGLLLCPQPTSHGTLALPWEQFAAVTFGYTLVEPKLHTVTATQFRGMAETMREARMRGYRRPGLVFEQTHNERTDRNYLGGYLAQQFGVSEALSVPPLLVDKYANLDAIGRWCRRFKPDVIITGDCRFLEKARAWGLRVPEKFGAVCPLLVSRDSALSGVLEDCFHIGEVAVDFVVAMIQRGERGVPQYPQRVHVEGAWVEGTTLPRKQGSKGGAE